MRLPRRASARDAGRGVELPLPRSGGGLGRGCGKPKHPLPASPAARKRRVSLLTAGSIDHRSLITEAEFAAAMAGLGPFEPRPRIAAAVSGGADSMALALLADGWAKARGGALLALSVDHGLRAESADEAAATVARLGARGIATRLLRLEGLAHGNAMAERARDARFAVLTRACASVGILHLLLGHHAGDQAETVLMRALGGSGPAGMAGMLPLVETASIRILRPLLGISPARLRATVVTAGLAWVEDPSNADRRALRPRLRMLRAGPRWCRRCDRRAGCRGCGVGARTGPAGLPDRVRVGGTRRAAA